MEKGSLSSFGSSVLIFLLMLSLAACGGGGYGGGNGGGGGGGGGNPPAAPTGLTATAGSGKVDLSWTTSAGATSYNVYRGNSAGGESATPLATGIANGSYTDNTGTAGATYYYVVAALNAYGKSGNSNEASAAPNGAVTAVSVTVDVLTDRHYISPYVYGVNFPPTAAYITNTNTSLVRWGGNASSTYNWLLHTYNADNDYYFEDFTFCGFGNFNSCTDSDSAQWIADVKAAGGKPLMTMPMLAWVAQSPESAGASGNLHWTFSVTQDGACASKIDPFNTDAGINLKSDCSTAMVASQAQLNRAYYPLLDDHTQACTSPSGTCEYRSDWVTDATKGLTQAFGSGSCVVPYFTNTSCHFYNMDNEIDIWGGTHVDVHPNPTTYNELRDIYLTEAGKLQTWDAQAVRFGWVSCCWGPYWGSAAGNSDKNSHGNVDFMPWWLNEIAWRDQINGSRTLDVFDLHAYPETSGNGKSLAQQRALALTDTQDWWDPTYTSQAWFGSVSVTSNEPNDQMPFRIPRVRAWANTIYPGTPVAFTEWNFAMAGETDFSTALADVDAWGILGRERASFATRWTASDPASPAYNSLLLYRNYDSHNGTFNPISVSATHNVNAGLFSVYASTNQTGNSLTLMVVNKDPANAAQVTFALNHFTPSQVTKYTLSQGSPNSITAGAQTAWSSTMTFAPYSATLLVVTGNATTLPAAEWDLNPDTIVVPAGGTLDIHPKLISGTGVTLGSPSSQGGVTVTTTNNTVSTGQQGDVQIVAGNTPGFYSFSIPATDTANVSTSQSGWILVTKAAAALSKTGGDGQAGTHGTPLPTNLSVTLSSSPTGSVAGVSVFFTITSGTGGSLKNVASGNGEKIFNGSKVIAVTNSSGVASVTLTLPPTTGAVTVSAEGPYAIGHPVIATPFGETSN